MARKGQYRIVPAALVPLLGLLSQLTTAQVREVVTLARWLRDGVEPDVEDLRPAVEDGVREAIERIARRRRGDADSR